MSPEVWKLHDAANYNMDQSKELEQAPDFTTVVEESITISPERRVPISQGISVTQFLKSHGCLVHQIAGRTPWVRFEAGPYIYECLEDPLGMVQYCIEDFIRFHYARYSVLSTLQQRLPYPTSGRILQSAYSIMSKLGCCVYENLDDMSVASQACTYLHWGRLNALKDRDLGKHVTFPYPIPDLHKVRKMFELRIATTRQGFHLSLNNWLSFREGDGRSIDKNDIERARGVLGFTKGEWAKQAVLIPHDKRLVEDFLLAFKDRVVAKARCGREVTEDEKDEAIVTNLLRFRGQLLLTHAHGEWWLQRRATA